MMLLLHFYSFARIKGKVIVSAILLLLSATFSHATIRYVKSGGAGSADGSSWGNASGDLQAMINASLAGDEIWVTEGVYLANRKANALNVINGSSDKRDNAFVLKKDVSIYGGFPASGLPTWGDRNWKLYVSVLSGDQNVNSTIDASDAIHVVISSGDVGNAILDGFTVKGGNAQNLAGTVNVNGNTIGRMFGGGMVVSTSSPSIKHCIFDSNTAANSGGGLYVRTGSPLLLDCVIRGNTSAAPGTGMDCRVGSSPQLIGCVFADNGNNDQLSCYDENDTRPVAPTIINSVFYSTGSVSNLVRNAGRYVKPVFTNCIFWGNATSSVLNEANGFGGPPAEATITYSIVKGGYSGTGNQNADPLFVNATAGDFRLQSCSPAINAGNNAVVPAMLTNPDGLPRIQHSIADLGIWEVNSLPGPGAVLAMAQVTGSAYQRSDGTTQYGTCSELIASVTGTGTGTSIAGNTTARVWIEASAPAEYCKRHYEITPDVNTSSTGKVTLYFTQDDFTSFNAVNPVPLPIDGADVDNNRQHLLIEKRGGVSSDGSGLPASYSGSVETIDPADADIVWNAAAGRWEVSFETTSFSGFFVKTIMSPLPVRLISFRGSANAEGNELSWRVADANNFSHFEVERSADARIFEAIGSVPYSNISGTYTFLDRLRSQVSSVVYYRLRLIDMDGSYKHSKPISLEFKPVVKVFPNPSSAYLTIESDVPISTNMQGVIYSVSGRKCLSFDWKDGSQPIDIRSLTHGRYVLVFSNGIRVPFIRD